MAPTAGSSPEQSAGPGPVPSGGRSLGSLVGRGAAWSVAANFAMRFASIAITALLARLLSQEDFGVFAIALAVFLVVSSLAELGMASAIARAPAEPDDIAPTVASISILVSLVAGLGMFFGADLIATALGQPAAAEPIQVLSFSLALTGMFAVPGAQLVREFRQDRIFLATIVGFLVGNPLLIFLAVNGGGAVAFAWSRVIGQLATGLVLYFSTSRRYVPGWRSDRVGPLIRFGIPLSLANLVNFTLLNADYLIIGRLVDAAHVGVYMIAFNVASWSTAILGSVLNSVVVPAFGRVSTDPARLRKTLASATELVALLAFPVGAVSLALAAPLITTIFGTKWDDAAPVLAVLAPYGVLFTFSLLFVNVMVATGKTLALLLIQVVWIAALVPAIVVGVHFWDLQGVGWAHLITIGVVALPLYLVSVLRTTGAGLAVLLSRVARPAAVAVVAGAAAWFVSRLFQAPWLGLLAGGSVGVIIYFAGVGPLVVRLLPSRLVPAWLPRRWRPAAAAKMGV